MRPPISSGTLFVLCQRSTGTNYIYHGPLRFSQRVAEKPSDKQDLKSASSTGPAPTRTYVIRPGDSLSKIAKQFYGRAADWHKLHEANYDKIRNPSILHPGEEIVIPQDIFTRNLVAAISLDHQFNFTSKWSPFFSSYFFNH